MAVTMAVLLNFCIEWFLKDINFKIKYLTILLFIVNLHTTVLFNLKCAKLEIKLFHLNLDTFYLSWNVQIKLHRICILPHMNYGWNIFIMCYTNTSFCYLYLYDIIIQLLYSTHNAEFKNINNEINSSNVNLCHICVYKIQTNVQNS